VPDGRRRTVKADLFLASFVVLFLELACIRWFPAHVLYLTFFTNLVLLGCFLGMSVGSLRARAARNDVLWTPALLAVALAAGLLVEGQQERLSALLDVGDQAHADLVFFGTERITRQLPPFVVPIELLGGAFMLLLALALAGPGQEMGRAFAALPDRVRAYAVSLAGSIAGILGFSACAWAEVTPAVWFLPVVLVLLRFGWRRAGRARPITRGAVVVASATVVLVAGAAIAGWPGGRPMWSPYYRIDYERESRLILVNLIAHQAMSARSAPGGGQSGYELPHLLRRDAGGRPFEDVLVIGAGSGNDVSHALGWGARRVDAVEIDPVIQRLGARDHPDRPYDDPRVTVHLDDGRNFLRSSDRRYDLIVYALVDSLVLHSSYSNLRLESFLFTREALADVRRHLKPGGLFAMYNFFRQGWIVARLDQTLEEVFGAKPLVFVLPYRREVTIESDGGFTVILAGDTEPIREAFRAAAGYWVRWDRPLGPATPDGFHAEPPSGDRAGQRIGPASVERPPGLRTPTDDWPHLYLRRPMIPPISIRALLVMGGIGILLLAPRLRRTAGDPHRARSALMFLLGGGFMLLETRAVVQFALLFGGTWSVNALVFLAILVLALAASLLVLRLGPAPAAPYWIGLFLSLTLNVVVPLDTLLGIGWRTQVVLASLLALGPVFFAGVVFARQFRDSETPEEDFGWNVAGAMAGGLVEYGSMLLGFRGLALFALATYTIAALTVRGFRTALPT